ncbi:MAG: serine protein kinase RIO [Streptosporangiaceae bacterium]
MPDHASPRRGKRRFDDNEEPAFAKRARQRRLPRLEVLDLADGVPGGDRWSTWDQSSPTERGPEPYPGWLVTELAATDTELGVLKTGKEADVFLIRRAVPGTSRTCLLAAKRYRAAEHRLFHRDAEYTDGLRVRESRDNRAMAKRTATGRAMIVRQWAGAEFAALRQLQQAGVPVPYPVQVSGTEVLLEFLGEPDGTAAPRLAELRPSGDDLAGLWDQLTRAVLTMAGLGLAHGDLSAYNLLVHQGRLVLIDLPQVIDVIAHPRGAEFLDRDASNITAWFRARGLDDARLADLAPALRAEARLG